MATPAHTKMEKPKRRRRSYSCGPCKLLKIKCDLHTPCSSCVKFKRADKCLADPPQPPSAEEQSRTMERKKRSLSKKPLIGTVLPASVKEEDEDDFDDEDDFSQPDFSQPDLLPRLQPTTAHPAHSAHLRPAIPASNIGPIAIGSHSSIGPIGSHSSIGPIGSHSSIGPIGSHSSIGPIGSHFAIGSAAVGSIGTHSIGTHFAGTHSIGTHSAVGSAGTHSAVGSVGSHSVGSVGSHSVGGSVGSVGGFIAQSPPTDDPSTRNTPSQAHAVYSSTSKGPISFMQPVAVQSSSSLYSQYAMFPHTTTVTPQPLASGRGYMQQIQHTLSQSYDYAFAREAYAPPTPTPPLHGLHPLPLPSQLSQTSQPSQIPQIPLQLSQLSQLPPMSSTPPEVATPTGSLRSLGSGIGLPPAHVGLTAPGSAGSAASGSGIGSALGSGFMGSASASGPGFSRAASASGPGSGAASTLGPGSGSASTSGPGSGSGSGPGLVGSLGLSSTVTPSGPLAGISAGAGAAERHHKHQNGADIDDDDFSVFEENKTTHIKLNHDHRNALRTLLPPLHEADTLANIAKNSQHPYILTDDDFKEHLEIYTKFYNTHIATHVDLRTIEVEEAKALSIMLSVFAIGDLFSPRSGTARLCAKRMRVARSIRERLCNPTSFESVNYLVEFYLFLRMYPFLIEDYSQSYLEFNLTLSYILLNDKFLETVAERIHYSPITKSIGRWMKLRTVQIEQPFLETRGTLLTSDPFKDLVLPHRLIINHVFPEHRTDMFGYVIALWSIYYKRAEQSTTLQGIIRSYLELYGNTQALTKNDVQKYEKIRHDSLALNRPITADVAKTVVLGRDSLFLLIKNQIGMSLFVRWLSFVRLESNYFPLLRYTSYITTLVSIFNHVKFLYNTGKQHGVNAIDSLYQEFGSFAFNYIFNCLMFQLIFLIVVANFLKRPTSNRVLNLYEIFKKVHADTQFVLAIIEESEAFRSHLVNVECFRVSLRACKRASVCAYELLQSTASEKCESLRDFLSYIDANVGVTDTKYIYQKQFGLYDGFARYVEKVWDLFVFLTLQKKSEGGEVERLMVTNTIELNEDLVNQWKDRFTGFELTDEIIDEYMKKVVEPNLA